MKWYFSQWNIDINLPYFLERFSENISLISKLQWCAFTTLGEASLISFYYSKFSTKSKTKFLSMQIICNGIYRGKFVEFQVISSLKAKGNWLFQSVKIPFPNANWLLPLFLYLHKKIIFCIFFIALVYWILNWPTYLKNTNVSLMLWKLKRMVNIVFYFFLFTTVHEGLSKSSIEYNISLQKRPDTFRKHAYNRILYKIDI